MSPKIEICSKVEYSRWWEQEMRDAQTSRADLRKPRVLSLLRGRVLVFKGFPGEPKIDADLDSFR